MLMKLVGWRSQCEVEAVERRRWLARGGSSCHGKQRQLAVRLQVRILKQRAPLSNNAGGDDAAGVLCSFPTPFFCPS
jgi:hypothetical protein